MNTIWSQYVQGVKTLYMSRKLRFGDRFAERYRALLGLNGNFKLLEVGCGPGALAGALRRWYPNAQITGLDRDSNFISFARAHESGIEFIEGDATALPFADGTFDTTISYTVSEHIEPAKFLGEQLRVLKNGGACIVLSNRKTIEEQAPCLAEGEYERAFWERVQTFGDTLSRYGIGKYRMSQAELPAAMEKYGFKDIKTEYIAVGLTPDDIQTPPEEARAIIDEWRQTVLDGLDNVRRSMPERFTAEQFEEMKRLTNAKYDERLALYEQGQKQWDFTMCLIMAVRGIK